MLLWLGCAPQVDQLPDWPERSACSAGPLQEELPLRRERARVNDLAVELLRPREEGCWPTLVLVPPGLEAGLPELDEQATEALAARGVVVVAFDPSGRGESPGEEDHDGPLHQDQLAAVLAWTALRADVDSSAVVLRSRSLGVAMAAGAMSRNPVLQVSALLDLEGPAQLPEDLEHVAERSRETLEAAATGEDWWLERSAAQSLGAFAGHYRRVQALDDHATGAWLGHAHTLLNTAATGNAAEVDLNGQARPTWTYAEVEEDALEGRVKADDPRALALLEELLSP